MLSALLCRAFSGLNMSLRDRTEPSLWHCRLSLYQLQTYTPLSIFEISLSIYEL
jgi:hypothetical protein